MKVYVFLVVSMGRSLSSCCSSTCSSSKVHPCTTRKMIYRNTWGPLLVSAGNNSRYHYWWAYQLKPKIHYWYRLG
jgi:hypothetical protein